MKQCCATCKDFRGVCCNANSPAWGADVSADAVCAAWNDPAKRDTAPVVKRPKNPYRKGSLIHAIMEGALEGEFDGKSAWEDMTAEQIAEVFGTSKRSVTAAICNIRKQTGYEVQYKRNNGRGETSK